MLWLFYGDVSLKFMTVIKYLIVIKYGFVFNGKPENKMRASTDAI